MSSELFKNFGNKQAPQQQDPKAAAMSRMKEMGINVPEGMENNPHALLQHVMQSGKVPNNRLNMAQQIMQRMFGRR